MIVGMRGIALMVVAVVGCGPTTADDDGGSGTESSTSTSTSTSTPTTTSTTPGDDGEGSTGAEQCDALLGHDGTEIVMSVRNARDTPIYLDMNGCGPVISLSGPDADAPTPWQFPDCDMPSCDSLVSGDCSVACGGGGGACQPEIVRLFPGGVHSHDWSGSVWAEVTAPAECTAPDCAPDCYQRVPALAGAYTMAARVYDECPLEDQAGCDCEPIEGQCTLVADNITVMPTEASATFEYPGQTAPEIVVQ
jgi:hypothetical protein